MTAIAIAIAAIGRAVIVLFGTIAIDDHTIIGLGGWKISEAALTTAAGGSVAKLVGGIIMEVIMEVIWVSRY